MKYLLDTDTVIAYLKNRPAVRALLIKLAADGLAMSLISYGEVYEGIYFGANQSTHELGLAALLRGVDLLGLNKSIMKRYARLRGGLRQSGMLIGDADTLIAATALHYDLTLVTANVRHFSRIANLTVLTPPQQ